jgi:hypothetical protein
MVASGSSWFVARSSWLVDCLGACRTRVIFCVLCGHRGKWVIVKRLFVREGRWCRRNVGSATWAECRLCGKARRFPADGWRTRAIFCVLCGHRGKRLIAMGLCVGRWSFGRKNARPAPPDSGVLGTFSTSCRDRDKGIGQSFRFEFRGVSRGFGLVFLVSG